ncbi:unnamed protein product [Effrenium voratum]|uniref:Uncharacterized protein n=1 Tax=Effrenium voratum TaxID=2562239 RepID=A0AA36J312_9DINO|nr:unnamed protein product [Effrenium voratum]
MSEDDEDVEQSAEEKQLEAEIKAIELDISLIDLRRELEAQEELLARWEESVLQLKDERREAETYHLHGAEDRKQERELQAELQQALRMLQIGDAKNEGGLFLVPSKRRKRAWRFCGRGWSSWKR